MPAAYGEDLASVHEAGFGDVARAAARELVGRLPPRARVVDLGCGGGTLAEALVQRGHAVWGCDLSPAMVALARRRVPEATFEVADVLGVAVPACDAAASVGEILNFALADRPLAAADNVFTRIHAALAPGGVFLFDVGTTDKPQGSHTARRQGRGWRVEADVRVRGDRLTRRIDTWRKVDGVERRSHEEHTQRLLPADWVEERLEAAGFAVERLGGYDDHAFEEGWEAFLARRVD